MRARYLSGAKYEPGLYFDNATFFHLSLVRAGCFWPFDPAVAPLPSLLWIACMDDVYSAQSVLHSVELAL